MSTPCTPAWIRALAALVAGVLLAGTARGESSDARFVDGLRQRRLFELAEKYCDDRLTREELRDEQRAELTIELSRTLAEHALNAPAPAAQALWQRATSVVEDFAARHAQSPQVPLVRLQGLLALAAQGEAARQMAGDRADAQANEAARDVLRQAVTGLEKLNDELAVQLRRQNRPAGPALSTGELQSLQMNVQFELARALRNQALCYPEGSADRINALTRAGEALAAVIRHNQRSPLTWNAELEEIARQRLLGEHSTAERKLVELDKTQPPPAVAQQIRAERMRLALARGRIDDALAEAGTANMPRGADVDFARLETLLAAWRRAVERHQNEIAADWQSRAAEQAQEIGRAYGAHWMRRAESLLAGTVAGSVGTQTAATASLAAAGYYRAGQLDQAIGAFDEAARLAREAQQSGAAFDAAYSAATIEKERGSFRAAIDRYHRLALGNKDHARAADAHLLAIYCAAQLAQASQPPRLEEYEKLLREHVATWPNGPSTSQAFNWLGRLEEHRRAWPEAIRWFEQVRPGAPQYAEAAAGIGRVYEAWLGDAEQRGGAGNHLADDALAALERIAGMAARGGASDATRAATLAAARIWLTELPNGAVPAERLLRGALETDKSAPEAWQVEARQWLVPALALQGKGAQANQALDELPRTAQQSLALLDAVEAVRRGQPEETGRKLAELELSIASRLLERREELDGDQLRAVRRRHAIRLAESGQLKAGLEELQALAREFPRDGQTQEDLANVLLGGNEADVRAALVKWKEVAGKSRPGTARWFRAHYGLATTQLKLGERRAALDTIQAVAARFPELGGAEQKARFEQLKSAAESGR